MLSVPDLMPGWEASSFYGLAPFHIEDWIFPALCPSEEREACLSYETKRHLVALSIEREREQGSQPDALRRAWHNLYELPWLLRSPGQRAKYRAEYAAETAYPKLNLRRMRAGSVYRLSGREGNEFIVDLDWDLTNRELVMRFENALADLRPESHKTRRTEGSEQMLRALAARRLYDNKPALTYLKKDIVDDVASACDCLQIAPLFSREQRFTESCRRCDILLSSLEILYSDTMTIEIGVRR